MNRREMLIRTGMGLTLGLGYGTAMSARADEKAKKRILMFTKSVGYEHEVVKRKGDKLSLAENIVTDLGAKHGFEVNATKDGRVFVNDDLSKYDVFVFETQGDLTKEGLDKQPPMTLEGKQAFLKAIALGKGYVGCHCASDTFHSPGGRDQNQPAEKIDPYIAMVGGEFVTHGEQQEGWMRVVDQAFPGIKNLKDFRIKEEWYALKNFARDLHVILVQDTEGMKGGEYHRPKFPATWAHMYHKGRVFYTSMGHREDVWENPLFQELLVAGINWAAGNVEADITPNLDKVAPHARELPAGKK